MTLWPGAGGGSVIPPTAGPIPVSGVYPTASTIVLSSRVTGDSNDRFQLLADGTQKWGGGSGATDLTFARSGVGAATLTGALTITSSLTVGGIINGQDQVRASQGAAGQINLGAIVSGKAGIAFGNLSDATINREAGPFLLASSIFAANDDLYARYSSTTTVVVGSLGGRAGVACGQTSDAWFSRLAAARFALSGASPTIAAPNGTGAGLLIATSTVNPTSAPTGGGWFYVATDGSAHYISPAGTDTTFGAA